MAQNEKSDPDQETIMDRIVVWCSPILTLGLIVSSYYLIYKFVPGEYIWTVAMLYSFNLALVGVTVAALCQSFHENIKKKEDQQ